MLERFLGAILVIMAIGCSTAPRDPSADLKLRTQRAMLLHADTSFAQNERDMIHEAQEDIQQQTLGMLQVNVVYDLDFQDLKPWANEVNLLIRAPEDAPYIDASDKNGIFLLGMVSHVDLDNYDPIRPMQVYLIVDRLRTHNGFVHVVEHEFYHLLGLKHVDDPMSIMYRKVTMDSSRTCINKADAIEMCRVYVCSFEDVKTCD